jgi:hypothetical protein
MSNQSQEILSANTLYPFKLKTLYSINDVQFIATNFYPSAEIDVISDPTDKNSFHPMAVKIKVTVDNQSRNLLYFTEENTFSQPLTLSYGGGSVPATRPTHVAYDCDEDCEPSHVMACFAMDDVQALFDGAPLPASLVEATIEGGLAGGETFVATIGGKHVTWTGPQPGGNGRLSLRVHPNPMNPKVDISFTLDRPARARVAIYDLAGRLLETIREGDF